MDSWHKLFNISAIALICASVSIAGCATAVTQTMVSTSTSPQATRETSTVCAPAQIPEIPQTTVNVAIAPYADESEVFHGVEQGFYKDVGITIGPEKYGLNVPYEQIPSVLASGRVDTAKYGFAALVPSLPQDTGIKTFSFSDLFVGFAIMCQPDFKTVKDFQAEGKDLDIAIAEAAKQMVGKTFVFAPDPSPLILIEPAFAKAGISLDDMEVIRVQDPQGMALMESKEADCQLPGAPIRVTLESLGYSPVIDMMDVAQAAEPSIDSAELRALELNGYVTTDDYWETNRDTLLRFASVGWRINDFINEDIDRAVASHIPFLNQLAGTTLNQDEGKAIYTKLDPFFTIDDQRDWFEQPASIFYHPTVIGAHIKGYEESGELPAGKYTYKDVSIAEEVYNEMMTYKADAEVAFDKLNLAGIKAEKGSSETPEGLYGMALEFYHWRDYLDAARFSEAALIAACVK